MKNKKDMIHFAIYTLLVAVILVISITNHNRVKALKREIDKQHLMLTIKDIQIEQIHKTIKDAINDNGN